MVFLGLVVLGLLAGLPSQLALSAEPAKPDTPAEPPKMPEQTPQPDSGDTAWMLASSALVMLMVPGLALFYGGIVRKKNILGTMMQSMVALAIIGIFWIAAGYSLAFGPPFIASSLGGFVGWDSRLVFLRGVVNTSELLPGTKIPIYVHVMFQGMFAIITPALISGAIAERIKFGTYCLFILLWSALVYCPLAHWVWAMDWWQLDVDLAKRGTTAVGCLGKMGAIDFAGGTVVHIAAGLAALGAILMLRKRYGYPQQAMHPSSMVLSLTGAALLWFGWFGFNGGSGLGSGALAGSAFAATQAAAAAAGLSWMLAEWLHKGKPTALGLASGIVAGLVAVTPASGYVYIWGGLSIGLIAGVVCYLAVCLKPLFGYDDSLDAFGVHGVGGFLGAVLTGVFCYKAVNEAGADGFLMNGNTTQLWYQLVAAGVSVVYALIVTMVLVKFLDLTLGFAVDETTEMVGLDQSEHGESGFDLEPAMESVGIRGTAEPRPASVPPDGHQRFSVVVEGVEPDKVLTAWSDLCIPGAVAPAQEFRTVYPNLTWVKGNRFQFRGGDPEQTSRALRRLLQEKLNGKSLQTKVVT